MPGLYEWEDATDYPRRFDCTDCTAPRWSEGADIDMAYKCAGECGERMCWNCYVYEGRHFCLTCCADAKAEGY